MATSIDAKIVAIRVYNGEDGIMYRVTIDKSFDAIVKQNDEFVDGVVNYVDFKPSVLIAQIINNVEDLGTIYSHQKEKCLVTGGEPFTAAILGAYINGSDITIERTRFTAGEEYTDRDGATLVHEHDGYNTEIVAIKLTDKGQARIDRKIDAILG